MPEKIELPEGWVEKKLGDIADRITKGATPTSYGYKFQNEGIRFIKIENIGNGRIDIFSIKQFISEEANENQQRSILQSGDILFTIAGTIGKSCLIDDKVLPANTNQAIAIIRGTSQIFNQYYLRFFLSSSFAIDQIILKARGGAMKNVSLIDVRNLSITIPPLPEQHRIVSAIEAIFSRLDAAESRLERVPEIMKHFRQSVLAAACDGRLTEDWRAENPDVEDANQILKDLTKRKLGLNFLKNQKPINHRDLEVIPNNWKWVYIGNLSDLTSGIAFKKNEYSDYGVKLLQIANVTFGRIIWEKQAFLPEDYIKKYPNLALKNHDLLMALNRPLLGDNLKIAFLSDEDVPSILYQRVGRFDFFKDDIKDYLYIFLRSPHFINKLKIDLRGVDQPFITKPNLLNKLIPLPPLPEQNEIVRRVDALFALADKIEKQAASAKERTEKLRQSVLAQAFSGRLVETEAEIAGREGRSYESAGEMLGRIRKNS